MHAGIDARLVSYRRGGTSTYIRHLIGGLAPLMTQDRLTVFGAHRGHGRDGEWPDLRLRTLWTPPHHRLERWTLPLELAAHRLDVLHSPDFIPPPSRRWASVITIHDLAFLRFPHTKDAEGLGYYGQVRRAVIEADAIIAVTEATRDDLRSMLGVPTGRVRVIYHGLSPAFHPVAPQAVAAFRHSHNLPQQFILWVGTIEPRKNLSALFRAMEALPDCALVIAGERGWGTQDEWETLSSLRRKGRAIYYGPASESELVMLYNASRAFAFPSLYEGFGFPPLEALACGVPVVVSATPALREVLAEAAYYVDPNDVTGLAECLCRIVADGEDRERLRQAGRARAASFRWDRCAGATLQVYREAAGR